MFLWIGTIVGLHFSCFSLIFIILFIVLHFSLYFYYYILLRVLYVILSFSIIRTIFVQSSHKILEETNVTIKSCIKLFNCLRFHHYHRLLFFIYFYHIIYSIIYLLYFCILYHTMLYYIHHLSLCIKTTLFSTFLLRSIHFILYIYI